MLLYVVYCALALAVWNEFNGVLSEPYMDEPFHVPQALAYCSGEWSTWDSKITTPPGLYLLTVLLQRIFIFKCNLSLLRLTPTLTLLALPLVLTRLLAFHKRRRPPPRMAPSIEALVLSTFPISSFFSFLYYTDVPSLLCVLCTVIAATENRHRLAALLGTVSCLFRQNNIIWVLYAYAASQLMRLRDESGGAVLHDPPALSAAPADIVRSITSAPKALPKLLPAFPPYMLVFALFGVFVAWNGGIVLGDKSNHIPSFHVPQVYYFLVFSTVIGWPAVLCGKGGPMKVATEVMSRMFGSKRRVMLTGMQWILMAFTIQRFTICHPFLLSDNRHYTFYIWRRVFMRHALVPYLLIPAYQACAWGWWLRVARDQTLLQTLIVPVLVFPALLPAPLVEPRYFLVPYVLLRAQIVDVEKYGVFVEGVWYGVINVGTIYVFLYSEREGVGRFMW